MFYGVSSHTAALWKNDILSTLLIIALNKDYYITQKGIVNKKINKLKFYAFMQ